MFNYNVSASDLCTAFNAIAIVSKQSLCDYIAFLFKQNIKVVNVTAINEEKTTQVYNIHCILDNGIVKFIVINNGVPIKISSDINFAVTHIVADSSKNAQIPCEYTEKSS